MPRVRRRSKARRESVTFEHVRMLLTGIGFFLGTSKQDRSDPESIRQIWSEIGEELLAQWISHFPGTRPWAWWKYDAPELRRCVNGTHPFDSEERKTLIANTVKRGAHKNYVRDCYKLYWGSPGCLLSHAGDFDREYEGDYCYLERLDLLEPGEADADIEYACGHAVCDHNRFVDGDSTFEPTPR